MSVTLSQSENPFLLARPELISAKKKLALVSSTYDPMKTNLKGFEVYSMSATEFREQLRQTCQIILTNEELGALVVLFDRDGDGRVNSHSFISEFLRLGNVERKKKLFYQQKVTKKLEQNKEKYSIDRERSLERLSLYSLAVSYSDEEAKSAYEKFSLMALTHDPQNPTPLLGFVNGGEMTPKEFKEQLRRSFHLQLSSGEIASLVHHFDSNENGLIDCHEFIRAFYQISFHERIQHNAKHQKIQNRLATQRLHHQHEVSQKFLSRAQVELKVPTDKTRQSTVQKLQLMALQYDSKQSSVQWGNMFKVFESSKITIKHFHEIIRRQFCLSFNSSELGVIYEMFHLPTSTRQLSGKQQSRLKGRARGGQRGRLREREGERQGHGEKAHILEEEDEEEQEEEENNEEEVSPSSQPQSSRSRSPLTDGSCVIDCQKFLSYFFQLCKVEKQKFTDQHLFLNRKLQQRKENYEKNLVKKLVRQKETTVSYPELPNVNLSMEFNASISSSAHASAMPLFTPAYSSSSHSPPSHQQQQLQQSSLESSLAFLDDPNGAGRPVTSSSARRPTRKLSVLDTIAPNRHVLKLFKQEKSLVNLYPLASEDTKNFIRDIERQEEEVKHITTVTKKTKTKTVSPSSSKLEFIHSKSRRPDSAPTQLFRR